MSSAESKDCWKTCDCGEEYLGELALILKGKATFAASSEKENALVWTREVDLVNRQHSQYQVSKCLLPIKRVYTPVHPSSDLQLGFGNSNILGWILVDAQIDHCPRRCANQGPAIEMVGVHRRIDCPEY
jgi:hypothetical protein